MLDLNNEIILLRKSLRSIVNQTKLNLIKKIKQTKKSGKDVTKKEDELNCFKRINIAEIPLSDGLYPDRLQKTLTDRNSSEIDRLHARILTNKIIQRTLIKLKEAKGDEVTDKFLKRNEKKIKQSVTKRIDNEVKEKIQQKKSEEKIKVKNEKKIQKGKLSADPKPGAFVKNPNFTGSASSDEIDDDEQLPKSEDPFFLSTSGENYMAKITTAVSESSEDECDQPPPSKKFKPRKDFKFEKRLTNVKPAPKVTPKIHQKPKDRPQNPENKPNDSDNNLHPSWAAKQQQKKLQTQEFKGTKIIFDE